MLNTPYTVELITTEDALGRIKSDWDRLSTAVDCPNVFTSYDWFNTWYSYFAKQGTPGLRRNVLVLRREGVVSGIAPLIGSVSNKFGLSLCRLHFASLDHEWDYNDLVLGDDPPGQMSAVADYLRREARNWDFIDLRDLRDAGNTIVRIETALQDSGLSYRIFPEEERSPYMPIQGSWQDTMRNHSRYIRRTLRKFAEKAQEGFRTRIIEDPSREPELLQRMIDLEAQKQVGGQLSIPFLGRHSKVFQSLFQTLGPRGWITVVVLERGDHLIASNFLYRCGKKLWGYLTAYDHAYADLSPGMILIPTVIDYAFANGFDELDFMNGEEPYKLRWATDFHQAYRLVIWNRRWTSRIRAHRRLHNVQIEPRQATRQAEEELLLASGMRGNDDN